MYLTKLYRFFIILTIILIPLSFTSNAQANVSGAKVFMEGASSFAINSDGTLWAWGKNEAGQLGDGSYTNRISPVRVKGPGGVGYLTDITDITCQSNTTTALKSDGTVWTWGTNEHGQLGIGSGNGSCTPVQVMGAGGTGYLTGITAISNFMALKNDGTVWCWGNSLGYAFFGNFNSTPVQQAGAGGSGYLTGIKAIYGTNINRIAVSNSGNVWVWGYDSIAQEYTDLLKIDAGYLSNIKYANGNNSKGALANNGSLYMWGRNFYGQIGDSTTTTFKYPPVLISSLTDIKSIVASDYYTMALKSNGTVWAWGLNNSGQLGIGTTSNSSTPVQVLGAGGIGYLSGISAVSCGGSSAIALKDDGTVWAWGKNNCGQFGNGTVSTTNTLIPIKTDMQLSTINITATANPSLGGMVTGAGNYYYGNTVTLNATPKPGYSFSGWIENGTVVSTDSNYSFTVLHNRTLVANFSLATYTISISSNPPDGGTTTGSGSYTYGNTVALVATPNSGYTFSGWTEGGSTISTSAVYSFIVDQNKTLVANFQVKAPDPVTFTITTTSNISNGGTITGGGTYNSGDTATVTASPSTDYTFTGWKENGGLVSNDASYSFAVSANRTLEAIFSSSQTSGKTIEYQYDLNGNLTRIIITP